MTPCECHGVRDCPTERWAAQRVRTPEAEEASRRIEDWYRRGWIMWSDLEHRSTHLRRVG